jgi:hypothetical protein
MLWMTLSVNLIAILTDSSSNAPPPPWARSIHLLGGKRDHIFVIRQPIVIFLLVAFFLCDIIIISCLRVHSLLQHSGPSCSPSHSIQDSRKHRLQT